MTVRAVQIDRVGGPETLEIREVPTPVAGSGRVLVIGAAGAIGGLVVQIATRAGHTVDGVVSRSAHTDLTQRLGAEFVATDPSDLPIHGYDAIVDTAGLAARGVDMNPFITDTGEYVATGENQSTVARGHSVGVERNPEQLNELVHMVDDGTLTLRVCAHYPLRGIRNAHRYAEAGGLPGKVVLVL